MSGAEVTRAASMPRRRNLGAWLPWITTPLLTAALVGAWEAYVRLSGVSAFILPAPGDVWAAWLDLLASPRAWQHTWMTVYATLAGFAWALVVGVAVSASSSVFIAAPIVLYSGRNRLRRDDAAAAPAGGKPAQ